MTARTCNIRAMRYVVYDDIPLYLSLGWHAPEPAHFSRLNYYGIEMLWLCDCDVPDKRKHR